ncbi:MAG TPA: aminopeptidase P family protein, partial [Phycisphaerae bacterium]|nr:aminopeptidase P family protein [Phycisphaerae bacterium]
MATRLKTPQHDKYSSRRRGVIRHANKMDTAGKSRKKIDAFLVSKDEDIRYLTGFTGEDSLLLTGPNWAHLVTDGRFTTQAQQECSGIDICIRDGSMSVAVSKIAKSHKVRRMGFQSNHLTVAMRDALVANLGEKTVVTSGDAPARVRQIKEACEVEGIVRAIKVAQKAFRKLTSQGMNGFVGKTEGQIAAKLEYLMRNFGADGPSFPSIVAAGANAALPHYSPGCNSKKISAGQCVLIDFGALVDGYCSDLTRVLFTGKIPPEIAEIYPVVLKAQKAGIAAIRAGVSCSKVDAAARSVIEDAGFGDKFIHSLGHGLG